MKIIPAMDLLDGCVVRLHQGDYEQVTIYNQDPLKQALEFKEAGFDRLHIVDLSGARSGSPQHAAIAAEIKQATGCSIEFGGGLRSLHDIEALVAAGLGENDYFMIGSLPFKNAAEFDKIVEKYAANLLLTVDVWQRDIRISGWQEDTRKDIFTFISECLERGLNSYLVTQIQKDGTLQGPDYELYEELLQRFANIELIASGGVGSLEHLEQLKKIKGLFGGILGKAFYAGNIILSDLK